MSRVSKDLECFRICCSRVSTECAADRECSGPRRPKCVAEGADDTCALEGSRDPPRHSTTKRTIRRE